MKLWVKNILFDPSSVVVPSRLERVSGIDNELGWNVKLRRYEVIVSLEVWCQKKSHSETVSPRTPGTHLRKRKDQKLDIYGSPSCGYHSSVSLVIRGCAHLSIWESALALSSSFSPEVFHKFI